MQIHRIQRNMTEESCRSLKQNHDLKEFIIIAFNSLTREIKKKLVNKIKKFQSVLFDFNQYNCKTNSDISSIKGRRSRLVSKCDFFYSFLYLV